MEIFSFSFQAESDEHFEPKYQNVSWVEEKWSIKIIPNPCFDIFHCSELIRSC